MVIISVNELVDILAIIIIFWLATDMYIRLVCASYCTGCGLVWAVDGNWKLTFPVCMFPVKATHLGIHGLHVPNVCPEQPSGNTPFCKEHLIVAQQRGYPCNVKEFLIYCGALKTAGMNEHLYLLSCSYLCIHRNSDSGRPV